MKTLYTFKALDILTQVVCPNQFCSNLLDISYASMRTNSNKIDLFYNIHSLKGEKNVHIITRNHGDTIVVRNDAEFLEYFEKDYLFELQAQRSDLLFFQAAVLEHQGQAFLIMSNPDDDKDKETLAWALSQSGFNYMSSKLAPVEPNKMVVNAFPNALRLRKKPGYYPLPANTYHNTFAYYLIPESINLRPLPISAIFFIDYKTNTPDLTIKEINRGECFARIYSNLLNQLCRSSDSTEFMQSVYTQMPSFKLVNPDLRLSCEAIRKKMDDLYAQSTATQTQPVRVTT